MNSNNKQLTVEQLEDCIRQSRQKCNQMYVELANILIKYCNGKDAEEIEKIFNNTQKDSCFITSLTILKFGIILSNHVVKELGENINAIYAVGSVSGGYCHNGKQKRILFSYLPNNDGSLYGLKITPTGLVMPDLDLEILCNTDPEKVKKVISSFLERDNIKDNFSEIPIDIRIIPEEDVNFYLDLSKQPSYLMFRLLFGPPLCLYGVDKFNVLLGKVKNISLGRAGLKDFPEWRMWSAYMDEVKIIKGGRHDKEILFSANDLKKMGDLYWFYSLRINKRNVKNPSNFPPSSKSRSIKFKIGYK